MDINNINLQESSASQKLLRFHLPYQDLNFRSRGNRNSTKKQALGACFCKLLNVPKHVDTRKFLASQE